MRENVLTCITVHRIKTLNKHDEVIAYPSVKETEREPKRIARPYAYRDGPASSLMVPA